MIYFSDAALLQGLKERKPDSLKQVYREFFPIARSIVERNCGNLQDVEDVFQDSIVVLYQRISVKDFEITCSLKTFFFAICRNVWKQRLDRKWRLVYQEDMVNEPCGDYELELFKVDEYRLERHRIMYEYFHSIPQDCQTIINCFVEGMSLKEIAKLIGKKSEIYVKTRKYLCRNMLRKKIMNDPRYKYIYLDE